MNKQKKASLPVWECANGHWSRVEYLQADGLFTPAFYPICNLKMELTTKELLPMLKNLPKEYTMSYKQKGGGKNGKNNSR